MEGAVSDSGSGGFSFLRSDGFGRDWIASSWLLAIPNALAIASVSGSMRFPASQDAGSLYDVRTECLEPSAGSIYFSLRAPTIRA